jgi:hypothetical protein
MNANAYVKTIIFSPVMHHINARYGGKNLSECGKIGTQT